MSQAKDKFISDFTRISYANDLYRDRLLRPSSLDIPFFKHAVLLPARRRNITESLAILEASNYAHTPQQQQEVLSRYEALNNYIRQVALNRLLMVTEFPEDVLIKDIPKERKIEELKEMLERTNKKYMEVAVAKASADPEARGLRSLEYERANIEQILKELYTS